MKFVTITVSPIDWVHNKVKVKLSSYTVNLQKQDLYLVITLDGLESTMNTIRSQQIKYIVVSERQDMTKLYLHFGYNIFDI